MILPENMRKDAIYVFLSILMSTKLPFPKIMEAMSNKLQQHIRTDEGMRNGIKYITSTVKPNLIALRNDLQICYTEQLANGEPFLLLAVFAKPNMPILNSLSTLENDTSLNGIPDFSRLFQDLDPELTMLQNIHPKVKEVASEMLGGKDFYTEFPLDPNKPCAKSMMKAFKSTDFAAVMAAAQATNFDLERLIKLFVLYRYGYDMDIAYRS